MQRFRFHLPALVLLMMTSSLGQCATFQQKPLIYFAGDSLSYLDAASAIAHQHQFLQSLRTPGYPLLLALFATLSGWTNYQFIVVAQMVIMLLTLVEGYFLVWYMTQQRWVACFAMVLLSINLYMLNWERAILTETLSFWSVVTLLLCYVVVIRRTHVATILGLMPLSVLAILIRPFFVFLPALLLILLLLYFIWQHQGRLHWKKIALAFILTYGCIVGYMFALSRATGFFGLTWVTNINAFGKVLEYHMQDETNNPLYAQLRLEAHDYTQQGQWEPWSFINIQANDTYTTQGKEIGAYSQDIIEHHLGTYLIKTLPDIYATWQAPPEFYAPYGNAPVGNFGPYTPFRNTPIGTTATGGGPLGMTHPSYEPFWVDILLAISTWEQATYWLLPLVTLYWGICFWKHSHDYCAFLCFAFALVVICSIGLVAEGSYNEFYRLRFPVDWMMITLSVITGVVLGKHIMRFIKSNYSLRKISLRDENHTDKDTMITSIEVCKDEKEQKF